MGFSTPSSTPLKPLKRVAVTGGAGQIAYNLLFRIGSGELLGADQPIALHILEIPDALKILEGVKMELEDCAFPLLKEIHVGSDPYKVFDSVHFALLAGSTPRGPGMERKDLLHLNGRIFSEQGKALNEVADPSVRVLVVGNPCNTNCWIAMHHAPKIPKENFHALTRLDENRAKQLLAARAERPVSSVERVTIWGNHSSTQVPDFEHATIDGKPLLTLIQDRAWLEGDFIQRVQKRGAEIIAMRGKSSAASAASAVVDAVHALIRPTPSGTWFSSAICSDNNPYGIVGDLLFSFPCRTKENGSIEIVPDLELSSFLRTKLKLTEKELLEERALVENLS